MAHYKKDGSLDMRYSSSRQASSSSSSGYVPSSGYGASSGHGSSSSYQAPTYSPYAGSSSSSASASDMHYKKDGSMDMRYSSSKQAAVGVSGCDPSSSFQSSVAAATGSGSGPGASHQSSASSHATPVDDIHYKKDGTMDMRFASSKTAAAGKSFDLTSELQNIQLTSSSQAVIAAVPANIPTKKDGTPDMRKKEAKEWVAQQAIVYHDQVPPKWVPKTKDGSIDVNKAIGRAFLGCQTSPQGNPTGRREKYWTDKCQTDEDFNREVRMQRNEAIHLPDVPPFVSQTPPTRQEPMREHHSTQSQPSAMLIPASIPQLEYSSLSFNGNEILGSGAFGVVLKATWNGIPVAVKKLHLSQLTNREKQSFINELNILNQLGKHENLVFLHGYCITPLCIVMELVELGSISYLLHYCDNPEIEAKMTVGRIKKGLIFDIVNGMRQLHVAGIVHGDIKPQNVLVTKVYRAKITDFGLATLRGKTSSSVDSRRMTDDDEDPHIAGGTAGYMAPELLDSVLPPDYPSDVYSFGILLNEMVTEEEPYSDQYRNFAGRGPFAAVNYAKQGKRPTINKQRTPVKLQNLIERCWSANAVDRPTFDRILEEIRDETFVINHSF